MPLPSVRDFEAARARMTPHVYHTPLLTSRMLSERTGYEVRLKAELFQRTGSYKIRGPLNKFTYLSDEQKRRGVICSSAGNHAQGVALAAKIHGIHAVVCMAANATPSKVEATRAYGAEVVLHGTIWDEANDRAKELVAERGWGPYPRSREEILLSHLPPAPTFDEHHDRWGFQAADGGWPIAPQFAEVQPFHDSVAWIRPVGLETWGLIDEAGRVLIDPRAGYVAAGGFSDGLAWVLNDELTKVDPEAGIPEGTSMEPCSRGAAVENKLRKNAAKHPVSDGGLKQK